MLGRRDTERPQIGTLDELFENSLYVVETEDRSPVGVENIDSNDLLYGRLLDVDEYYVLYK